MEFPKTLTKDATYQCGHTLHRTETVHTYDEEECFVCWMYGNELCPDCKEQNARKYREVYAAIENPQHDGYTILFKRRMPIWSGSVLFEERLENRDKDENGAGHRTTKFLVEYATNHHGHKPVGLYKGENFVPFIGYTVEYMQFLLRHDREAVQAEDNLRNATVNDWKKSLAVGDGSVVPPGVKDVSDSDVLYTRASYDWGV